MGGRHHHLSSRALHFEKVISIASRHQTVFLNNDTCRIELMASIIIVWFLYELVTLPSLSTDLECLPNSEIPFPPLITNVHCCYCFNQSVYHILVKSRYFKRDLSYSVFYIHVIAMHSIMDFILL